VREGQLQGLSYDAAVQKIAEATHLSWQQVADAHGRFKLAAEAEATFRDQLRESQEQTGERETGIHTNRISGAAAE
jgi:alkylated DNA nucleotide flippase Atl1